MTVKKNPTLIPLRAIAMVLLLIGAVISLVLMLHAGRKNNSVLLVALFVAWVMSPFAGLFVTDKISMRWSLRTRMALYYLILFITSGSVVVYSGALSPPGTKPAFVFLVVPLLSWLLIVTVIPIAKKMSRKNDGD
jgi:hypothetical protein